ncbi:MAG: hypothetical protein JWQ90_5260 [Hydrocarboniphaga sp.]|nr:hypothetical protein [Hydrocarboniphaga sp.]
MLDVAVAGDRWVAVGMRGLIETSDDQGQHWVQSDSPVQSDLLAVCFPSASKGWVVGHDGVILHSEDGGKTWVRQLDGRVAGPAFKEYYRAAAASGDAQAVAATELLELNYKAGPSLPYLDVWFDDDRSGYAVGSYGILAGTQDGGKTWQPLLDRIDNDEKVNLNAIHAVGSELYIAGEQGHVFKLDRETGRFRDIKTEYGGSFFGVTGDDSVVLLYGLRGTVYRSADHGQSWQKVEAPSQATLNAGARLPNGQFVLANSAGQLLIGDVQATRFELVKPDKPMTFTSVQPLKDAKSLIAAGLGGVSLESLPAVTQ